MLMAGRKMKTEKILCEVCDNHCELEVEVEDEEVQDIFAVSFFSGQNL